jgi:hypothetical protein
MPEQETIRRAERDKKANLPPRKPVSLSVKKWNTFARESMAPDLQSKPLPSACPRLAVLASIFLLLPARKHHPLARRKEHPRPSLPANAPNPRSAHSVARVLLLPLPPRFPVSHKPAPASAVPQAVIAPPRKLRKPGLTIGRSGAANYQAGARLRFCRGGFTPPSRRAELSSDSTRLAITGLQP